MPTRRLWKLSHQSCFCAPSLTLPRKRGRECTEFAAWFLPTAFADALILHAAETAHDLPFLRGYRLHGEARIFRERHLLEAPLGLDRRQRHRFRKRLHCLDVDREKHAFLVCGIVIALADDLGDADDLLLLAGVIEQRVLAFLHLLQVPAGGEIAHAGPRLALGAAVDLIVPGKYVGLGFQKPVGHSFLPLECVGTLPFAHPTTSIPPRGTAASTTFRSPDPRSRGRRGCRRRRWRSACRRPSRSPSRPAPAR